MRIFILEDDEARILAFEQALSVWKGTKNHDVTIARWLNGPDGAYKQFKPPYDLILLDHDLGGQQFVDSNEEETGVQFVRWLGAAPTTHTPFVIIHSYNPDGARAMDNLLRANGWNRVVRLPFGQQLLEYLATLEDKC